MNTPTRRQLWVQTQIKAHPLAQMERPSSAHSQAEIAAQQARQHATALYRQAIAATLAHRQMANDPR